MPDREELERLKALDARIKAMKGAQEAPPPRQDHHSIAQVAWRMVIELVTGLGIGFGIGYGLDWLLGTMPIMLVLFTLLGFAAGVRIMLRTAQELNPVSTAAAAPESAAKEEDKTRG